MRLSKPFNVGLPFSILINQKIPTKRSTLKQREQNGTQQSIPFVMHTAYSYAYQHHSFQPLFRLANFYEFTFRRLEAYCFCSLSFIVFHFLRFHKKLNDHFRDNFSLRWLFILLPGYFQHTIFFGNNSKIYKLQIITDGKSNRKPRTVTSTNCCVCLFVYDCERDRELSARAWVCVPVHVLQTNGYTINSI